jgi:hypothetical protein
MPKFAGYYLFMMKKFALLLFTLVLFSCGNDTASINGYWEIESVNMPGGKEKDYTISPTIDYFEMKGNKGFRKKVMPQLDGTYMASDLSEDVTLSEKDGKTYLNYATKFAKWQEELVSVSSDALVIKNAHGMEYHYKKPEKFSIK